MPGRCINWDSCPLFKLLSSCCLAILLHSSLVHHLKVARSLLSYRTAPPFIHYLLCCIFCFSLSVTCQPSSLLSNEVHHISVQHNCILRGSIAAGLQNVGLHFVWKFVSTLPSNVSTDLLVPYG
jgi:hypothetical protein